MTAIIGDLTPYDLGDRVTCSGVFTNSGGTAIDPTTVKFSVRAPSGTITTYVYGADAALIKDSAGHYHVDVDVDEAGQWFYRFFSLGIGKAGGEETFEVKAAACAP